MTDVEHVEALRRSRIAHELRGPAGVALGAAAELLRRHPDEQFIGMMRRGLERVLRVADRLSRSSALERGLVSFNISAEDLRQTIKQEVLRVQALENRSGIEVEIALPEHPVVLGFDAEWVAFCIGEVVCNAIQHARKKVRITLEAGPMIVVEDDGPGFREEPDFSFTAVPSPRRGVGLSLSIVNHVVAMGHKGSLAVQQRASGGARVVLDFTKREAAAKEAE
jgi:signal transduction histidine kinase